MLPRRDGKDALVSPAKKASVGRGFFGMGFRCGRLFLGLRLQCADIIGLAEISVRQLSAANAGICASGSFFNCCGEFTRPR